LKHFEFKEKDSDFSSLYIMIDRLHQAFVLHMDRMGQLEIRVLSEKRSA
jgi:hypothetical protein